MDDGFCWFGELPRDQCAHCREVDRVYVAWARDIRAMDAAGRQMLAQNYAAAVYGAIDWPALRAAAFPQENPWAELADKAAIHGFGPWLISEFYGTCRCCGKRWEPGEMIRFCEDENGWACSSCGAAGTA